MQPLVNKTKRPNKIFNQQVDKILSILDASSKIGMSIEKKWFVFSQ